MKLLNIYDKFDRPSELDGYDKHYPFLNLLEKFNYDPQDLTDNEKQILSAHKDKFKSSASAAYTYARYIINERWPDGEQAIMDSPEWAFYYVKNVIKGRWPEGETIIKTEPRTAYEYTRDVINKDKPNPPIRWKEAEPIIMRDTSTALNYLNNFVKGRWPELEASSLMQKSSKLQKEYKKYINA